MIYKWDVGRHFEEKAIITVEDNEKQLNPGLNWQECGELNMAEFTYEGMQFLAFR